MADYRTLNPATPVHVTGYMPCHLTTGRPNRHGEYQVVFEGGTRRWFRLGRLVIDEEID